MQFFMVLVGFILVLLTIIFMTFVFVQAVAFLLCVPVWVYIVMSMVYIFWPK